MRPRHLQKAIRRFCEWAVCALLVIQPLSLVARAQNAPPDGSCDRSRRPVDAPLGYRWRVDRCEGIFKQPTAGEELSVTSFTRSFANFDPSTERSVALHWRVLPGMDVHLQARGYRLDPYYAMDALRPSNIDRYAWPTDVLEKLRYRGIDIGVTASGQKVVGGLERTIYLPLVVGTMPAGDDMRSRYEIALVPPLTVTEITIRLTRLRQDGSSDTTAVRQHRGNFPGEEPARLPLDVLGPTGLYRLDIGATGRRGRSFTSPPFFFYHVATW